MGTALVYTYINTMEYYSAIKNKSWHNMDGYRRYYAKWTVRERQTLHDFPYIWNLKKQNTQENRKRLTDTENKWVVARGE